MQKLAAILSSSAKTAVLDALYFQSFPTSLRELGHLTELGSRSVQLALRSLERDGMLIKRDREFSLNRQHIFYPALKKLFTEARKTKNTLRAESYSQKAKEALAFASESLELISQVKR